MKHLVTVRAGLSGLAVWVGLRVAGDAAPEVVNRFSQAAAWLAAALLGVPLQGGAEPIVATPVLPVQIVSSVLGGLHVLPHLPALAAATFHTAMGVAGPPPPVADARAIWYILALWPLT
jgi:hypothetical protein